MKRFRSAESASEKNPILNSSANSSLVVSSGVYGCVVASTGMYVCMAVWWLVVGLRVMTVHHAHATSS